VKFHTDEHVANAVVMGLRRRGQDVTTSAQVRLLGKSDEEQLAFCDREQRVMVSHDPDMLRLAAAGVSHAGVAFCHSQKYKTGRFIGKLLALAARIPPEKMRGRIEYL
jgi:hypothetical protein